MEKLIHKILQWNVNSQQLYKRYFKSFPNLKRFLYNQRQVLRWLQGWEGFAHPNTAPTQYVHPSVDWSASVIRCQPKRKRLETHQPCDNRRRSSPFPYSPQQPSATDGIEGCMHVRVCVYMLETRIHTYTIHSGRTTQMNSGISNIMSFSPF